MRIQNILIGLATLALASVASAATIALDTGVAPWMIGGNPAVVETGLPPVWITPVGASKWVGTTSTDASTGAAAGTYVFTLALGTYAGAPGSFSINYATDNDVTWTILNGSLGGTTSCSTTDCFSSANGAPRVLTGNYTAGAILTATILNEGKDPSPMGLLVSGNATSGVPEPSTYAMVGIGAAAVLLSRYRRA